MSKSTNPPALGERFQTREFLHPEQQEFRDGSELRDSLLKEVARETALFPMPCPGERLGGRGGSRYELLGLLGGGGMGRVFRALDHELQRLVALKFLLTRLTLPGWDGLSLLREEAKAIAQLNHENILRVHDVAEWVTRQRADGEELTPLQRIPFLVMEYLEGESLEVRLRRGVPELRRTFDIMLDVAAGLEHAHKRHVVHHDLKPSNVFILLDGRVKLLDFGLARRVTGLSSAPPLHGAGTPEYMSPEQWRREPLNARTDTWAAGILLFEMLTGELPFPGLRGQELRDRILSSEPMPSVCTRRPELPVKVERLVAAALAKNPAERIPSGVELSKRLEELREHLGLQVRGPRMGFAERRQVTLVCCRLVPTSGFVGGLDPEDSSEMEASFHHVCTGIVAQHGGALTTCVGAEVLACFGYPRSREDDSERAVRAALHLREVLPRELSGSWSQRTAIKVGVHTDMVVLAAATPEFHGTTPSMQGEAPSLATWLATQATPGSVLLSERTYELVRGRFKSQPMGSRAFEGLSGATSISVHLAQQELHDVSRFDRALVAGALTPLVGRDAELGDLVERWKEVVTSRGSSILLRGEAGVGKSRLLQELHDWEPPGVSTWARCQCWPQFKESALYPLVRWLQRSLGLTGEDSPQGKKQRLEERLSVLGLPREDAPALASLLSLPVPEDSPFRDLAPERQRERRLKALWSFLQRLSEQRPLIFVVEDLHWADPSTLQFIEQLLAHIDKARLFLLLTARPEFVHTWTGQPGFQELELRPLAPEDSAAMVREAAQGRPLPAVAVAQVVARTDGIPLFIEEVTRMLLERESSSRASTGGLPFPIPTTLHELLLDRLDRLPPRRKALVQFAATLAREFSYDMMRAVLFLREDELLPELEQLERAGLLLHQGEPPHATYTFKHALIHDAAYQSLPRGTRQRYHTRIAEVLTEQFPEVVDEQPELLALHSTRAGLVKQALDSWQRAGQRAAAKSAFAEAITHFLRALEQLSRLPASHKRDLREIGLQNELGQVLISTKGFSVKEVEDVYSRTRALCEQLGVIPPCVLWGLTNVPLVRGDRESTKQLAVLLQRLVASSDDMRTLLVAHTKLATIFFWQGAYVACREHCTRARALLQEKDIPRFMEQIRGGSDAYSADTLLYAYLYLSYSELMLGHTGRARAVYQEALTLAEATHYPYAVATVLMFGAALEYEVGAPAAALEVSGRAIALAAENGFPFVLAVGQCLHGWATSRLGDVGAGIREMHAGLALIRGMGAMVMYPRKLTYLLTAYLLEERTEEALAAARETLEMTRTSLARDALPELLRLRGECLLQRGEVMAAQDCMRQAVAEAHASGALLHELRACLSLARLLRHLGEEHEARTLLAGVRDRFTDGASVGDYQAAQRFLDERA